MATGELAAVKIVKIEPGTVAIITLYNTVYTTLKALFSVWTVHLNAENSTNRD